jgi:hypothetical protein
MKIIEELILRMLIHFKLYPNIFLTFMPFKIYEFKEIQKGIKFLRDDLILDIGCANGL